MKNIALIFGGESCESEISAITAKYAENIIFDKYNIYKIILKKGKKYFFDSDINSENIDKIEKTGKEVRFENGKMIAVKGLRKREVPIDCALVCCHGGEGENGSLSGALEMARIPYTCSEPAASGICMDKVLTKKMMAAMKIPTVPYKVYRKEEGWEDTIKDTAQYPLIVKPARQGSSIGVSVARNIEELKRGMGIAFGFDNKILTEKMLDDNREFTCAVADVGGEIVVGDIEETVKEGDIFDFEGKYTARKAERRVPDETTIPSEKIRSRTAFVYRTLELKGVVRIDYLYQNEKLYLNEINTVPGCLAAYMFRGKGISPAALLGGVIASAIRRNNEKARLLTEINSGILDSALSTIIK